MLKTVLAACALLCALTINAEARQRHKSYAAHERCNIDWPCEGVTASPRGEYIARSGFGSAKKFYTPRHAKADYRSGIRSRPGRRAKPTRTETATYGAPNGSVGYTVRQAVSQVVSHPAGCPARAFCGCGAAVRVFGKPVRDLWLAASWLRFPRATPAPGMVAARRGHVFVLESHISGNTWLAYDANSGRHQTRIHARSLAGYTVVNPHGSRYASAL